MARVRNTFWRKQIDKLVQSENIPVVFKQYLNFGTTGGEPGYGFRDNAGTIQFKNSGGSWTNLGSGGSASAWGSITGTLSDQTDLQTALDAKLARTVTVTSGNVSAGSSANTDYVYFVAGAHTVSLPAAPGNTSRYTIKNNHTANITIDTVGAETIDGSASISVAPEESVQIISDGTNFNIV